MSDSDTDSGQLMKEGWSQGAMFSLPEVSFYALRFDEEGRVVPGGFDTPTASDEAIYVVVSQDCDIVSDPSREPFVEAMVCTADIVGDYRLKALNSYRWFDVGAEDLVVHAAYRVSIAKSALRGITPRPWPGSSQKRERFQRWLGRRSGRKAIDDALVKAIVQPVKKVLVKQADKPRGKAFNRVVREVRFTVISDGPPFRYVLVLLLNDEDVSDTDWDGYHEMKSILQDKLGQNDLSSLVSVESYSEATMSVKLYRMTLPLDVDGLTYRGDELRGAEPLSI